MPKAQSSLVISTSHARASPEDSYSDQDHNGGNPWEPNKSASDRLGNRRKCILYLTGGFTGLWSDHGDEQCR